MTAKEVVKNTDTLKGQGLKKLAIVQIDKDASVEPEVVGSLVIDNTSGTPVAITTAELKEKPIPFRGGFRGGWEGFAPPNEVIPVNGDGTFTVEGKPLVPIMTGIKVSGSSVIAKVGERVIQVSLPWGFHGRNTAFEKLEFSLYEVPGDNVSNYYFLDKESSVVITDRNISRHPWRHQTPSQGVLALVNACSKNDTVIKDNVLLNVTSENNVLNDTTLVLQRDPNTTFGRDNYVEFNHDSLSYRDSEFRGCTITNAKLAVGTYLHSNICRTTISCAGSAQVTDAHCNGLYLESGTLSLHDVTLQESRMRAEGSLVIKGTAFMHENFDAGNVYITDKFSLLKIIVPHGEVQLVRSSNREFSLSLSYQAGTPLPLTASREEILKVVTTLIHQYRHSEKLPKGYEVIVDHVVDTVLSRLNVINTLADAKLLLDEVSPIRYNDYARNDPYGC